MTFFYEVAPLAARMGMTEHAACITLGISGSTEQQYRGAGMSREVAERRALQAGLHPYEVWPEMVEHDIESLMAECAATDCTGRFLPKPAQRFCSSRCGRRARQRRYRAAHPEQQAKDRERARRYHRETYRPRRRLWIATDLSTHLCTEKDGAVLWQSPGADADDEGMNHNGVIRGQRSA